MMIILAEAAAAASTPPFHCPTFNYMLWVTPHFLIVHPTIHRSSPQGESFEVSQVAT